MAKRLITQEQLDFLVEGLAEEIRMSGYSNDCHIYPVPRGGIPVAYMLQRHLRTCKLVSNPDQADFILDDICDSGATVRKYQESHSHLEFFTLINKKATEFKDDWIVFPWEESEEKSIEDNIVRLLQYVGEDPTRGGLIETPKRVAKAWNHWCSGYEKDIGAIFKSFEDGAENYDEMVTVRGIPFYTHCEHHLAPFFGTIDVSYIPDKKIVGLSKLSRVVDAFARRLQVQERLTNQIADAIVEHLQPIGVGIHVKARHLCMESRGICQQGHHTVTTALRGVIRSDAQARDEFLKTVL